MCMSLLTLRMQRWIRVCRRANLFDSLHLLYTCELPCLDLRGSLSRCSRPARINLSLPSIASDRTFAHPSHPLLPAQCRFATSVRRQTEGILSQQNRHAPEDCKEREKRGRKKADKRRGSHGKQRIDWIALHPSGHRQWVWIVGSFSQDSHSLYYLLTLQLQSWQSL